MMHRAWSLALAAVTVGGASVGACTSVGLTDAGSAPGAGGNDGTGQTGVPCDVAQVLANGCLSCHGSPTAGGAPMSLVTYADLMAPSSNPAKTEAQLSVERMQAGTMPPGGGSSAADIATLQAWIDAGAPQEDCGSVVDPFGGPLTCTSGQTWPVDVEAPQMNPGEACIQCHDAEVVEEPFIPRFDIAGTVYAMGHETNSCYGIDGTTPDYADVIVRIHDANEDDFDLHPNGSGNFYLEKGTTTFTPPYTAKVISSKGERAMSHSQSSGDCNLCHTAQAGGNGSAAPGRIVIPY